MSHTVVLFHSALGLRPAVRRFGEALRAAGHEVHTPDLFDGEVFDDLAAGIRKRDALGIEVLGARALEAVADLPPHVVYAGFSMGAASAEFLATTRPGARGLVLIHGVVPPHYLGLSAWPAVPVQVHAGTQDPWAPRAEIEAFAAFVHAGDTPCEVHWYDVPGHLFADDEAPEFNTAAAASMLGRVQAFLASLPAR